MRDFTDFKPSVESYQFPGDPQRNNLLIFKGKLKSKDGTGFAIKVILQSGFPHRAPKAYID